ncbi:DUF1566 domain-containing protein [Ideonella sp. 4Y11]|uniref:DUF1566 domain-containing protein n=1 Tax=Ideonella aquatica TaxID=2824119 RepID=A0A940YK26_9BURK|nr:DUF1566 domain-containing protein [Ideonella aquatica]MBQ0959299.1 DUF1566 domain-containing protein [Ideonella aquatica]
MKMLKVLAAMALVLTGWAAQAGPFFASKDGSMVWDQATRLVWMRCSMGQRWNTKTCVGNAVGYIYVDLQSAVKQLNANGGFGGQADWQVPSIRQLASIRECDKGWSIKAQDIGDGGLLVPERCADGSSSPSVDLLAFPETDSRYFWSSSAFQGGRGPNWGIDFGSGYVGDGGRLYDVQGRLVRATSMSMDEAKFAFPQNLANIRQALARAAALEREAVERKERLQKEAERREAEEAERSAFAAAARKGPQQLYLLAGQSQRGKSIEINGRSFGTIELYELIVDKFPSSEYAVRASDQLNAMDRSERAQSAAYRAAEAQRQADQNASNRAQCFSNVRSCEANCANSWSRDYRMAQSCISGCQRTCN